MLDRRRNVRDKIPCGGVTEHGAHGATMDCAVRNISKGEGACVEFESAARARADQPDCAQGTLVPRAPDLAAAHHDL